MDQYAQQIQQWVVQYGPPVLGALAALVIGWFIAILLRGLVAKGVDRLSFARKANEAAPPGRPSVGRSLGEALYWIVILVALSVALSVLGLEAVLAPLNAMLSEFLGFLPNVIGAALIFFIGVVIATVAQRAIVGVLTAAQLDNWAEKVGLSRVTGAKGLSSAIGVLAFTLILIVVAIPALDALGLQSISMPATSMLQEVLLAIPRIFAACVVLLIAYLLARAAAGLLRAILPQLGFDKTAGALGLSTTEAPDALTPSSVAANLAFAAIMIFGAIEATQLLNFDILSALLTEVLTIGAQVIFGAAIIAFGFIFAGVIKRAIASTGPEERRLVSLFAYWAIAILAIAIGLRQMGLANEIIIVGFSLILGAAAVAAALAFGLGGRDWAKRQLERRAPPE